jgi:hypothetical protein
MTVTCPECGGDGGGDDGLGGRWEWTECRYCRGLGYIGTEPLDEDDITEMLE